MLFSILDNRKAIWMKLFLSSGEELLKPQQDVCVCVREMSGKNIIHCQQFAKRAGSNGLSLKLGSLSEILRFSTTADFCLFTFFQPNFPVGHQTWKKQLQTYFCCCKMLEMGIYVIWAYSGPATVTYLHMKWKPQFSRDFQGGLLFLYPPKPL